MVVLQQARRATRTLVDVPFLFGAAAAPVLLATLQLAAQEIHPLANVAATGVGFLVSPLLVAGLLGSAADALGGTTPSWSRWLAWGRDRYVALLLANLGFFAVVTAVGTAFAVVAFVLIVVGVAFDTAGGVAVLGLVLTAAVLALALVAGVLFAYYSAAAVVGGDGPVAALRGSVRLAGSHLGTTFGYVVLNFLVSTVLALPAYVVVLQFIELPPGASTFGLRSLPASILAVLAVLGFVTSTTATAFGSTLLVGVYRALRDGDSPGDAPPVDHGTG